MKFMTSNVLICLFLYLVLPLVHWLTDFNAAYLIGIITIWLFTVFYHELGHCVMAKTRGMKISFISFLPGMYMNGRWYFKIPSYFSFGAMLAYKPLNKNHITKNDIIILNLGGFIFNMIALFILVAIKHLYSIENSYLEFAILINLLIGVLTILPFAADGKSIWKLISGKHDELLFYDSMNYYFDEDVEAQKILSDIEPNRDIIANYARNLAWIEKEEMKGDFREIYEADLKDDEGLNLNLIKAFQLMFKHADGHMLSQEEVELFNKVATSLYFNFGPVYKYMKTKDKKILKNLLNHSSWFPSKREDKLFSKAIRKIIEHG
jgi:hypothetical protein